LLVLHSAGDPGYRLLATALRKAAMHVAAALSKLARRYGMA
jgi:hypothetical protein